MASGTTVKLVLPSEIGLVDVAHEVSQKLATRAGLNAEAGLDMALAVREAVINAMKHGNRLDPARTVELEMTLGEAAMTVAVRDQGEGFDPSATADPTAAGNVMRTSGRGLLLIRSYVDEVGFARLPGEGMEITMVKRSRPHKARRRA